MTWGREEAGIGGGAGPLAEPISLSLEMQKVREANPASSPPGQQCLGLGKTHRKVHPCAVVARGALRKRGSCGWLSGCRASTDLLLTWISILPAGSPVSLGPEDTSAITLIHWTTQLMLSDFHGGCEADGSGGGRRGWEGGWVHVSDGDATGAEPAQWREMWSTELGGRMGQGSPVTPVEELDWASP